MAPPKRAFGVPYNRHTVVGLKFFLDALSKSYKPSSSKKIFFSALVRFEKSLDSKDKAAVVIHSQAYYNAKNTPDAALAEGDLSVILQRLRQNQAEYDQNEAGKTKGTIDKTAGRNSNKISHPKRKHSEISKGTRSSKENQSKTSKSRECSVCFDDVLDKFFPTANITATCQHENSVCNACIGAHVDSSIDIGQFRFMACPMCPEVLVLEDVRRLCGRETFEKYDRLITRTALQEDPTFHLCLGPNCGSGQYNSDEESHKMVCAVCQFATCTHHRIAWHEGETCEEYDNALKDLLAEVELQKASDELKREAKRAEEARKEKAKKEKALADAKALRVRHALDNAASVAYVKNKAKTCPNKKCGANIQKIHGCDHMQCTRCGSDFCWQCMRDWYGRHRHSCPYRQPMYDRYGVWIGN